MVWIFIAHWEIYVKNEDLTPMFFWFAKRSQARRPRLIEFFMWMLLAELHL
jgi:hypothetical protein